MRLVETVPQALKTLLDPPAHCACGDLEPSRDLRRLEPLCVTQQDGRAKRFIKLSHEPRQELLELMTREQLLASLRGYLSLFG